MKKSLVDYLEELNGVADLSDYTTEEVYSFLDECTFQYERELPNFPGRFYRMNENLFLYWDDELMMGFAANSYEELLREVDKYYDKQESKYPKTRCFVDENYEFIKYIETDLINIEKLVRAEEYDLLSYIAFFDNECNLLLKSKHSDVFKIFQQIKDYRAFKNSGNRSIGFGLNPYKDQFPLHTEELKNVLSTNLKVEAQVLDYSKASLSTIGPIFLDLAQDEAWFLKNFMPLIAYLGEVFLRNEGGSWKMRLEDDKCTWIPSLITRDGKYLPIFSWVWENFMLEETITLPILQIYDLMTTNIFRTFH